MNHFHIADMQCFGCPDISKDKLVFLGNLLVEIYQAKLQWKFPHISCTVEFLTPVDADHLIAYQLSFWSRRNA